MWKQYIQRLSALPGQPTLGLLAGASDYELLECESLIRIAIPEDLKAVYRLCNGQVIRSFPTFPLFPLGHEFLPLSDVAVLWQQLHEARTTELHAKQTFLWKPNWMPFAQTVGGGYFCYVVADIGNRIVQFYPESTQETTYAASFNEFLKLLIADIDAGKLKFDPLNNCLLY